MGTQQLPDTLREFLSDRQRPRPDIASSLRAIDRENLDSPATVIAWCNRAALALARAGELDGALAACEQVVTSVMRCQATRDTIPWTLAVDSQINIARLIAMRDEEPTDRMLHGMISHVRHGSFDGCDHWHLPPSIAEPLSAAAARARFQLLAGYVEIKSARLQRGKRFAELRAFADDIVREWPRACAHGITEPLEVLAHCDGRIPKLSDRAPANLKTRTTTIVAVQSELAKIRRSPAVGVDSLIDTYSTVISNNHVFEYSDTIDVIERTVKREVAAHGKDADEIWARRFGGSRTSSAAVTSTKADSGSADLLLAAIRRVSDNAFVWAAA